MLKSLCLLLIGVYLTHAWLDEGHMLVFQISMLRNPQLEQKLSNDFKIDQAYFPCAQALVSNAVWPDKLSDLKCNEFQDWHHKNNPYSPDKQPTKPPNTSNAQWALNQLWESINSSNPWVKAMSLRFFIHIMGDIHQPLHAISLFSKTFPNGDDGGNLFWVWATESHSKNFYPKKYCLHEVWDTAGLTLTKTYDYPLTQSDESQIRTKAAQMLVQNYQSCDEATKEFPPGTPFAEKVNTWLGESYNKAIIYAYDDGKLKNNVTLSDDYLSQASRTSQRQIVRAGCRLALLF